MAAMTGPEHFVEHADESSVHSLLDVQGLGPCKLTIIMRCAVFREAMGSIVANPAIVHRCCQEVVSHWLAGVALKLPGIQDLMC